LGVSLESPFIFIDSSNNISEDNVDLARDNSDSDDRCSPSSDIDKSSRDINYNEPITVLTNWLKKLGWKVKWYTSGDYIDAASIPDRLVTISKRQIPRHQYYSLLHECAHVNLLGGPTDTRMGEPNGYLDLFYGNVNERTLRHRVAIVIDEISAWEHGIKLANQLGLGIDYQKYRDFRNRNLKSYFEWALERDDIESYDS